MIPFQNCFKIDIDLSFVSFETALKAWKEANPEQIATIIWIHPGDVDIAQQILVEHPDMTYCITPEYTESQWSVGTLDNYGFGAAGL